MYSRKRILNITSKKKKDTMLPWTGEQNSNVTGASGPRTFNASDGLITLLWCPTKRQRLTSDNPTSAPNVADDATRTASTCYYRGLKEKYIVRTTGSAAWRWRRICFTFRSDAFLQLPTVNPGIYQAVLDNLTSNGYARSLNAYNATDLNQQEMLNRVYAYVFQGTQFSDWATPLTAKVDNDRVTLKYDRTITIQSGNDAGVIKDFNFWHPMNRNLHYDEDERGGVTQNGDFSALTSRSMGDYYVMDMVTCNDSSSEESLVMSPTATLYWHERQ